MCGVCCFPRDVKAGTVYTYRVLTFSREMESVPSPELTHELGAPYCGDGVIQR